MGRELPRLFHRAGLVDRTVIPVTVTFGAYAPADQTLALAAELERVRASRMVSAAAADGWARGPHEADQAGEFFAAISGFIFRGRKP